MKTSISNIFILFSLIVIFACDTKPYTSKAENVLSGDELSEKVYFTNHGYHTGIILPASKVNLKLPTLYERFGNAHYYEFGWGDAGFYQAEKITTGLALKAILWPTDPVMHVVAVSGEPDTYFASSETVEIMVRESQLDSLMKFIIQSFARDPEGDIHALKRGLYGDSQFYKAQGTYFLTNTCNTWTAKGLQSLGMDINVTFYLTAESIMDYLEKSGLPKKVPSP